MHGASMSRKGLPGVIIGAGLLLPPLLWKLDGPGTLKFVVPVLLVTLFLCSCQGILGRGPQPHEVLCAFPEASGATEIKLEPQRSRLIWMGLLGSGMSVRTVESASVP